MEAENVPVCTRVIFAFTFDHEHPPWPTVSPPNALLSSTNTTPASMPGLKAISSLPSLRLPPQPSKLHILNKKRTSSRRSAGRCGIAIGSVYRCVTFKKSDSLVYLRY